MGRLRPLEPAKGRARFSPIDAFFRSLAADAKEHAVGIVLSGTGSDGTLGVKEIKAQSGMTMAQEEGSARYSAMPHSAIASLHVDYVLSPRAMPRQLISYAGSATRRTKLLTDQVADAADLFGRIFALLRTRTGHDFSYYKGSTIRRRVERRINVHQMDSLADYLTYLHQTPAEVDRLFKELLIGVTSFFRDPEAHESLASSVLPELVSNKPDGYVLRAWVPGCSTGEEAYSLAIAIKEAMEQARVHVACRSSPRTSTRTPSR
jgi:two-component system CheB/CheR fusion protein